MKIYFICFIISAVFGLNGLVNAQNPVVYFPFSGSANDISGNGNHGTVTGAVLTEDRFGNINSAYYFDGVDDRINFTLTPNPTHLSMSCWFNTADNYTNAPVLSTNGGGGFSISNGNISLGLEIGAGDYSNQTAVAINNDQWYHIGITYDGSKVYYYFNGSQVYTTDDTDAIDYDGPGFFIGCNFTQNNYYEGLIDDILIYDYAIDSSEMVNQYYSGLCWDTVTVYDTITIEVFDTTYVTVYDSIAVTDTLIIDVVLTGVAPPDNINTIKVYPNPTSDYVIINTGDYNQMSTYNIKIVNTLGQTVFENLVDQQEFQINVNTFGGYGTYFIRIFDDEAILKEERILILE